MILQEFLPYPPGGLFTGNVNSGSEVTQNLEFPIYAAKLRFYPQTWYSRIGMAVKVNGYAYSYAPGKLRTIMKVNEYAYSYAPGKLRALKYTDTHTPMLLVS